MSAEKLAELIEGIAAGKTIQMIWGGKEMYVSMEKRSLEDYLCVFLQPLDKYTLFRVAPVEVKLDPEKPIAQQCFINVTNNPEVQKYLAEFKSTLLCASNSGYSKWKFHKEGMNHCELTALQLLIKEIPNSYGNSTFVIFNFT